MIYSIRQLVGKDEELLGKWVKITPEEEVAIRESIVGENYARGAIGKGSLRLYVQDGHAVACTFAIQAETHPTSEPQEPPPPILQEKIFVAK